MNPLNFAHPPGAFAGTPGGDGIVAGNAPFQELPYAGFAILPMLLDQRPQALA